MEKVTRKLAEFLSRQQICLVSSADNLAGPNTILPVPYRCRAELELEIWLPRWADLTYYLEEGAGEVLAVVLDSLSSPLCWLQYRGIARPVPPTAIEYWPVIEGGGAPWPELYRVFTLRPRRLQLFDQHNGWGAAETLDQPWV